MITFCPFVLAFTRSKARSKAWERGNQESSS